MAELDRQKALDHVVVVMFENRSFDQLLGRLYRPGEVRSFEGVVGKDLSNLIPAWAEHGADRAVVHYCWYPDPGEEYQHINTQLFGHIYPPSNRGVLAERGLLSLGTSSFNAEKQIRRSKEDKNVLLDQSKGDDYIDRSCHCARTTCSVWMTWLNAVGQRCVAGCRL